MSAVLVKPDERAVGPVCQSATVATGWTPDGGRNCEQREDRIGQLGLEGQAGYGKLHADEHNN